MNEEEVRGKLLLPFLNDLGFNVSEIKLELHYPPILGQQIRCFNIFIKLHFCNKFRWAFCSSGIDEIFRSCKI